MYRKKNRVDVVVGVTPDLAERIENHRKRLGEKAGEVVNRTTTLRDLLVIALDLVEKDEEPAKPSEPRPLETVVSGIRASLGTATPRFAAERDSD